MNLLSKNDLYRSIYLIEVKLCHPLLAIIAVQLLSLSIFIKNMEKAQPRVLIYMDDPVSSFRHYQKLPRKF